MKIGLAKLPLLRRIRFKRQRPTPRLIFVGAFIVIGLVALVITHAVAPSFFLEPEGNPVAGNACTGSDATASGGGYVHFGSSNCTSSSGSLKLTGLDSTIRANWTAPTDSNVKWQVISAWTGDGNTANGSKLIGSKVLGATATAADLNGLRSGDTFTIKLQTLDANGNLSSAVSAVAATSPQAPIANAAYFDNFDDATPGPLNSNYYDVRAWSGYGDTANIPDARIAFASERHFHGEVIESQGQGGILIRSRVPGYLINTDGSARTMTFQTEVDMPPIQSVHGKWFEIHFSSIPANDSAQYGAGQGDTFVNDVRFAIDNQACNGGFNSPSIRVNINGNTGSDSQGGQLFCGDKGQHFTPANVRVPVVIKISQTSAEMFINGKSVVKATGFTLPFTKGYWNILDSNYRSAYDGSFGGISPTITNDLSHWDMIQYDGPAGSSNPIVKTYLQPNCDGFVYMQYHSTPNCPPFITSGTDGAVTLTIPSGDDVSKIRSAKLLFNGPIPNGMQISMNGSSLTNMAPADTTTDTIEQLNSYDLTSAQVAQLKTGANVFNFHTSGVISYDGVTQLELEVVYNQTRTIGNPPQDFMPMMSVTNNNMRFDHIAGQPDVVTGTTYLYALGADMPANYTISQINHGDSGDASRPGADAWFTITSPTTGAIKPVPAGGQLIPVNFTIDFSKFIQPHIPAPDSAPGMGVPAILKITGGGTMPVYVAILAVKDQITTPIPMASYTNNELIFNKVALP